MNFYKFLIVFLSLFLTSCSAGQKDLEKSFLDSKTMDESLVIAKQIENLERKSLPIFTIILSALIDDELKLKNYGKISVCLDSLYRLAEKGIFSRDEAIVLLQILEKQKTISDTLKTANIINKITGINVGYDKNFVDKYTSSDEPNRNEMIQKWRTHIEGMK